MFFEWPVGCGGAAGAKEDRSATPSHARRFDTVGVNITAICEATDSAWSVGLRRQCAGDELSKSELDRMSRMKAACVEHIKTIVGYIGDVRTDCSKLVASLGGCATARA